MPQDLQGIHKEYIYTEVTFCISTNCTMWLTELYTQSLFPFQTKVGVEKRLRVDNVQRQSDSVNLVVQAQLTMVSTLAEVRKTIEALTECFKQGNKLIDNMQEFGDRLVAAIEKTLNVLGEIHHEGIKHIYQVESALDALVLVAQKAFAFFDKVDNVISYCGGDSMAAAREELRFSVDLQQAGGLW